MARVKLTKNELKNQKNSLKQFNRYLPTLMLKKQQLQTVIRQVEEQIEKVQQQREVQKNSLNRWVALFGEPLELDAIIRIDHIRHSMGNIAGVDIPLYEGVDFTEKEVDLLTTPPWLDRGVDALKSLAELDAEIAILEEQILHLGRELRVTAQRVNLFEKVKIPEAKEAIRKITIAQGDQQTAAVVRGKISKNKLTEVQV